MAELICLPLVGPKATIPPLLILDRHHTTPSLLLNLLLPPLISFILLLGLIPDSEVCALARIAATEGHWDAAYALLDDLKKKVSLFESSSS